MRTKEEQKYLQKFGLNLRRIREEKGWTLEYTEEKGWHHWQYLQKIETGKKDVGLLTLRKLSKLYSMPSKKFLEKL